MSNGRIAVLCPSRGNPEGLAKLIESVKNTSERAAVITYVERPQAGLYREVLSSGPAVWHLGEPGGPAAKAGVPIYSPAISDSVHGLAIATGRVRSGHRLVFDVIGDVLETSHIALTSKGTGVIYVGGGTPKNFIQQAEVAAYIYARELPGHKYGVQITMDQPQWGGLSGCTFEEAQSWRKIAPDADFVTLNVEATVALPLIVSALAEELPDVRSRRTLPQLDFGPSAREKEDRA